MIRDLQSGEEYLLIYDQPGNLETCIAWLKSYRLSVVHHESSPPEMSKKPLRILIVKKEDE